MNGVAMNTFTIDANNNITAFASLDDAQAAKIHNAEYFGSSQELAKLEAQHGPLPATLEAMSPSGSVHRYFNHPGFYVIDSESVIATRRPDGTIVLAAWNLFLPEDAGHSNDMTLEFKGLKVQNYYD